MTLRIASSLALAMAALAACEKAAPQPKGSGSLDAAELALFKFLPKGALVYFGGDYSKLQDFMKSGMGQLATVVSDKMSPSMSALTTCLATPRTMKSAMSMTLANNTFDDRIVIDGLTIADVARCGKQAGLETSVDPDGKYVSVTLPMANGTFDFAYFQLATGALYVHQMINLGQKALPTVAPRAQCEAELAALGHATAAEDPSFTALAAKADRTKTAWFVGSGSGTAYADTVGEGYGSIDATSGLALDFTVQLVKASDADKVEQGVAQLRKMSDQMPSSFKDVVAAFKLARSGDRLHATLALSDAQVRSVSEQLGGMVGAQMH